MNEDPNPYTPIDENRKHSLSFGNLTFANRYRQREWNPSGQRHGLGLEFAMIELAGEVGEACNVLKKIVRHRRGLKGGVADVNALVEEIADVVICADLVAIELGINLGDAVREKFNKTSETHGFSTRL